MGQFPPPEFLAEYEKLVPGSAARIFAMAESQSQHRQQIEKLVIGGDVKKSWWGRWTGFAVALAGIAGSVALGIYSQPWPASILSGTTIIGLVSVFVVGSHNRKKEREEKSDPTKPSDQKPEKQVTKSKKK